MKRSALSALASVAALGLLASATSSALAGSEEDLFGPRYHSVSVTKDGKPRSLVEGTKLRVEFTRGGRSDEARWDSGCNFFGSQIEVGETAIDFGPIVSTAIGCETAFMRQDRFFARFFASDPEWTAEGRFATLSNARIEIELKRRVRPPGE